METYYYDGNSYEDMDEVLEAVRQDVDLNFGDADFDDILRSNGGTEVDGIGFATSSSLKRHSYQEYKIYRAEIIDRVVSEVREGMELELFPIRVPFTFGVIECSERGPFLIYPELYYRTSVNAKEPSALQISHGEGAPCRDGGSGTCDSHRPYLPRER